LFDAPVEGNPFDNIPKIAAGGVLEPAGDSTDSKQVSKIAQTHGSARLKIVLVHSAKATACAQGLCSRELIVFPPPVARKSIWNRPRSLEEHLKKILTVRKQISFFTEKLNLRHRHDRVRGSRQMAERSSGAKARLRNRNSTGQDIPPGRSQARERIEQSKLIELVESICSEINMEAGELRVESLSYLPPQAILRSFVVVSGNADYEKQIELRSLEPVVTFLARKWRDSSRNPCVVLLCWLGALKPAGVRREFACAVDENGLTRDDVEKWFRYLLSGLGRKFRPPKRTASGPGVNPFRADWQKTDRAVVKTTAALS
jgi:hypothetical protein